MKSVGTDEVIKLSRPPSILNRAGACNRAIIVKSAWQTTLLDRALTEGPRLHLVFGNIGSAANGGGYYLHTAA